MRKQDTRDANHRLLIVLCKRGGSIMINLINVEAIQTIALTILTAFGLATPATAAGAVPEEYQGVGRGARLQGELSKRTSERRRSGICRLPPNADLKFRSSGTTYEHRLS
jgi:hypothetical protein